MHNNTRDNPTRAFKKLRLKVGQFQTYTHNKWGWCRACGSLQKGQGTPYDARELPCVECREPFVWGIGAALFDGFMTIRNPTPERPLGEICLD